MRFDPDDAGMGEVSDEDSAILARASEIIARMPTMKNAADEGEEVREQIERAMEDACAYHPRHWKRTLNRIEIEPRAE